MLLFLHACTNKASEVQEFMPEEEVAMEQQFGVELTYTDSARKKMLLKADEVHSYPQLEDPKLVFPKGIDVTFYDRQEKEDSHLRADHAIRFPKRFLWQASGNVKVTNKEGEMLETEFLNWNERKEIIFSEEFVRITTGNQVIMGEGFEADQSFSNYRITKVTGELYLEDDQTP